MPYFLLLKKQQNLKLSSAANYRWRLKDSPDFGTCHITCCSFSNNNVGNIGASNVLDGQRSDGILKKEST